MGAIIPQTGVQEKRGGATVGTKPYAASGKYIDRMSNYCKSCRYDVDKKTGDDACPFNTLYWDFLHRHRDTFADNQRMGFAMSNLERVADDDVETIRTRARGLRREWGVGAISR